MQRTSLGLQPIREVTRTHSFAVTGPFRAYPALAQGAQIEMEQVAGDAVGELGMVPVYSVQKKTPPSPSGALRGSEAPWRRSTLSCGGPP